YRFLYSIESTPRTTLYNLSLHDALPIYIPGRIVRLVAREVNKRKLAIHVGVRNIRQHNAVGDDHKPTIRIERNNPFNLFPSIFRSEEHTSELQSRENLVCRLLLEKKKIK